MDRNKSQDMRLWVVLGITVISLSFQIVSHYAIVQNELKHIWTSLSKIELRIEKIEDKMWDK